MKLSKRLEGIASLVPLGHSLGDIGSDHGLLVSYIIENKMVPFAFASDNKLGPYERLKNNLKKYPNVTVSLSSGLEALPNNIDTVSITGMGGDLVSKILKEDKNNLKNVKFLLLGPQGNEELVRRTLDELGYKIDEEIIVFEDHYYQIMLCSLGNEDYSNLDYAFGPILRKKKDELFIKMYLEEKLVLNNLISNPKISNNKKDQFKKRIDLIDKII
jgi:tRNA (adenine22-N1)-methyltransferase